MKFAIITDGNNELGMGHVYQSITLAKMIMSEVKDADVIFLTKSSRAVTELIGKNGFEAKAFPTDDVIFDWLNETRPDRIIFDKLDVAPELAQRIKLELQIKLIIFTNLTSANDYADVTIMAGMGSNFQNIHRFNKLKDRVEFWGPKYWLIREEFFKFPQKKTPNNIRNIILLFGGADKANLSTNVLKELVSINIPLNILVVLGSAFEHRNEIDVVLSNSKNESTTIQVLSNINNVEEFMFSSDLAFVSPGLSFFESLIVGTPVVCFHQNEFQQQAWKGFIDTYDVEDISRIPELLLGREFIFPMDSFITNMEVGTGALDIVMEIVKE